MPLDKHAIFEAAFNLPYEGRRELVDRLLETLEEPDQEKIERAWREEVERRLKEYRAGKVKAIPASEVFESLRARTAQ